MKKIIFSLLPSVLALLYGAGELIIYAITGHVYFSSFFVWELIIYVALGLAYIFWVFRMDHSALRVVVYGTVIGAIVFFLVGSLIFMKLDIFFVCEQEKIIERTSLDGKYIVKEYSENCGAVSDFETVFEVRNLESKEEQRVLSLKGEVIDECDSSWIATKTLLIECQGNRPVQIHSFKEQLGDIKIAFKLPDSYFIYDHPKPSQQ